MNDAYAAGIVDGEGCIRIVKQSKPNGYTEWNMTVSVTNTSRLLLEALQAAYGGGIYVERNYEGHPTRRSTWLWVLDRGHAARFLERVLSYLIVKKEQAEVALQFRMTIPETSRGTRRGTDPSVLEYRELLRQKIVYLKGQKPGANGLHVRVEHQRPVVNVDEMLQELLA